MVVLLESVYKDVSQYGMESNADFLGWYEILIVCIESRIVFPPLENGNIYVVVDMIFI